MSCIHIHDEQSPNIKRCSTHNISGNVQCDSVGSGNCSDSPVNVESYQTNNKLCTERSSSPIVGSDCRNTCIETNNFNIHSHEPSMPKCDTSFGCQIEHMNFSSVSENFNKCLMYKTHPVTPSLTKNVPEQHFNYQQATDGSNTQLQTSYQNSSQKFSGVSQCQAGRLTQKPANLQFPGCITSHTPVPSTSPANLVSCVSNLQIGGQLKDRTKASVNLQFKAHKCKVSSISDHNSSKQHHQINCQYTRSRATISHRSNDVLQSVYQTGRITRPSQESSSFQVTQSQNSHTDTKPDLQVPPKMVAYVSDPPNGPKLQYEQLEDRLKTFILPPPWEGLLDAHSMAEAGFVYTGQEDLVYCFSCNIKLDGWTKHMDPLLRHKEDSPTCLFVRQQLQVIKGEKRKVKSVIAPSKPLSPQQTASISQLQLQTSTLVTSKPIHTVVTGLDEPRSSYANRGGDEFLLSPLSINAENYSSESERIRSFIGWPLNESIHPEQLARVGFVYTGEGSLVQCFQCGVRHRNWLKGDVPLSVHQKCNPRCPFLHTLTSKTKSIEEQRPSFSFIQPEGMSSSTENEAVTLEFPNYTDQATRLQSFKYWGGVVPKEELAETGFYMIARRDIVRCFSCHVVLQDWERTDNVIEEHRRHSPNCSFLKSYLYSISASSRTISSVDKAYSIEKAVEKKNRDYHSPQFNPLSSLSSLDINQPPSIEKGSHQPSVPGFIVNEGLPLGNESLPSRNESLPIRNEGQPMRNEGLPLRNEGLPLRNEGLPRSIDNSEQPTGIRYPPSWASNPPTEMSPPPGTYDSEESASSQKKLEYMQQSIATTSKNKQIVYEESLSQGMEENNISMRANEGKDDDDESAAPTTAGLCQICYDKKIECIFLPCGHARTCEECATRIKNSGQPCPYCRKSVSTTHRIYL